MRTWCLQLAVCTHGYMPNLLCHWLGRDCMVVHPLLSTLPLSGIGILSGIVCVCALVDNHCTCLILSPSQCGGEKHVPVTILKVATVSSLVIKDIKSVKHYKHSQPLVSYIIGDGILGILPVQSLFEYNLWNKNTFHQFTNHAHVFLCRLHSVMSRFSVL